MSWFVAKLRDDVERGLQTAALAHRFEWLVVDLAASGEDTAAVAVFVATSPAGEIYLTPGCAPFLRRLLEGLESSACAPPATERLVLLGGDAAWCGGPLERQRRRAS